MIDQFRTPTLNPKRTEQLTDANDNLKKADVMLCFLAICFYLYLFPHFRYLSNK